MKKKEVMVLLQGAVAQMTQEDVAVLVDTPVNKEHGDFTTNIAMLLSKILTQPPLGIASSLVELLKKDAKSGVFSEITAVAPGFINFTLSPEVLVAGLVKTATEDEAHAGGEAAQRVMVEYGHPNTHKEMHIGHMRTLITGEAIARILEYSGATVFRANYQGDIGPHVTKALFGTQKIMQDENLGLETVRNRSNKDKAHFLGRGYVRGVLEYEHHKDQIDAINKEMYQKRSDFQELYEETRQWSLDYYEEFYKRFGTKFDHLFFESEMADPGKKIVESHNGDVFIKENGAIIFPGEKFGLHTRVLITQAGNPTYEGKEMANAYAEYEAFPFDRKIHVVGSEQAGYFQVVFKALELMDPEKFKSKQHHVSMGMVQFTDRKMSSRTGDILRVDWLLDQVKERVEKMMEEGRIEAEDKEKVVEQIVIGAVKYSVLKVGTGQDVAFDIERSLSLEGDSGPYLQYTFARTQSVVRKGQMANSKMENSNHKPFAISYSLISEELQLLRTLYQFDDVVADAAEKLAPNVLCTYLFDLAKSFNLFYQKVPILKSDDEQRMFRLLLTSVVGKTLKRGLELLGIESPEKM